MINKFKKIAIIIDAPNWAFHTIAKLIQKELSNEAIVDIFAYKAAPYNNNLYMLLEDVKEYDTIHFLWRKILLDFESEDFLSELKSRNINFDEYVSLFKNKITTAVCDHLFLDDKTIKDYSCIFNKYSTKYYTISKKLYDIYCNIDEYPNPQMIIHDTFDKEKFYPINLERFNDTTARPLVIGWVGNSNWNIKDGNNIDYKGLHTVINPVIDSLISQGYNIEKKYADRQIIQIPNEEMVNYYKDIDIYVNCSYQEGTPMPIVEAMACGVPLISTDVGIVCEIFSDIQKNYILGDRTKTSDDIIQENLKKAIIQIYNDRTILKKLSNESVRVASQIASTSNKKLYKKFFLE